jgi:bacteriorhodopsin
VGYVLGAMGSGVEEMVLAYNVADLVNKVGFVIIVWHGVRNAESSRALAHDMEAGFHTLAHAEDKQDNAPSDDLLAIAAMSRGETVEEPEDDL